MNSKTIIILAVGAAVVYFFIIAPAQKPQPTGVAGLAADVSKLIGDFV